MEIRTNSKLPCQVKKSPLMMLAFLSLWGICLFIYGPELIKTINESKTMGEHIVLIALSLLFVFFWMLGSYYSTILIFSIFIKKDKEPGKIVIENKVPIAILYPTCDDFQKDAIMTCLNQNYTNCHTFILDDSNSDEYKERIDSFYKENHLKTTVIRRKIRKGFKAGNLNHALQLIANDYPYFVVVDADERLPENFVEIALNILEKENYAFVQANHKPNPNQAHHFSRDLSNTIIPFWEVHCKLRNKYGLVIFVGHGAMIRSEAWKAVGGFPEMITEDLAFSFELRSKQMDGYYLENLICYEDFPINYQSFRRQQERYITGTTQVLHHYLHKVIKNKNVGLVEKLDMLLWCLPLYVPAFVFLILLVGSIGLFCFFGEWKTLNITFLGEEYNLISFRKITLMAGGFNSLDFKIFSIICSLSPIFTSVLLGIKKEMKIIRLIVLSTVPYLSLMVTSWRCIFSYFINETLTFKSTGSDIQKNNSLTFYILLELIVAIILVLLSIISINPGYFALSSCLIIGFILRYISWENQMIKIASASCFFIIIIQMVISLFTFLPSDSMIPLIFSVHF